jgi:hypothetical protein
MRVPGFATVKELPVESTCLGLLAGKSPAEIARKLAVRIKRRAQAKFLAPERWREPCIRSGANVTPTFIRKTLHDNALPVEGSGIASWGLQLR